MIRGGPSHGNPAIKLAEVDPPADLRERERSLWLRLAPIADERARTRAPGGTCVASDLLGWRFLIGTIAFCERLAGSDVGRIAPSESRETARLAAEVLATFYLHPSDLLVN